MPTLREAIGDVWDSLAVSGAATSSIRLNVPHAAGRPLPSSAGPDVGPTTLEPLPLPTLVAVVVGGGA